MTKTKKGKVIVVATSKSMTDAKMKKTYYTDFIIAKAVGLHEGVVRSYRVPRDDRRHDIIKGFQTVYVISKDDLQSAAEALWKQEEQGSSGQTVYKSVEEVRDAIRALA